MKINTTKIQSDPDYQTLYMKYLGTLRVLGDAAAHIREHHEETRESIDACMEDAGEFLSERVEVRPILLCWELEVKG
jgi:hypothetical protein